MITLPDSHAATEPGQLPVVFTADSPGVYCFTLQKLEENPGHFGLNGWDAPFLFPPSGLPGRSALTLHMKAADTLTYGGYPALLAGVRLGDDLESE